MQTKWLRTALAVSLVTFGFNVFAQEEPAAGTEGEPANQDIEEVQLSSSSLAGNVDIIPANFTGVGNCIPFGTNTGFGFSGFIYRNIPPFTLLPGDFIRFDLGALNNVNTRRNIYFAIANKNPAPPVGSFNVVPQGIRALGWTQVVFESQTPLNPRGNFVRGDYELTYTAERAFSFPGGGLIVGFGSTPPGTYVDGGCDQVLVKTFAQDASNRFYARFCFAPNLSLGDLDNTCGGTAVELGGMLLRAGNPCSNDTTHPTISCSANVSADTDAGSCSATLNVGTPTANDNCTTPVVTGSRSDGAALSAPYPKGSTTITWTATDAAGNSSSCTQTVTVSDREAPSVTAPANVNVGNDLGACAAAVDPGTASVADNCPGASVSGARSDGLALSAPYPVGTTSITWTATDASGNSASASQSVVVRDVEGPSISGLSVDQPQLEPPNHRMVDVSVDFAVNDNCGVASTSVTVSSNEPIDGLGDGDTSPDWEVVDVHHVLLRAERSGTGSGRIYTITVSATDIHGNVSSQSVTSTVPHN